MTIYICIDIDEGYYIDDVITDLDAFLEELNECMETDYTTMEQFNDTEQYRTLYQIKIQ
jgi:hypothetical protein